MTADPPNPLSKFCFFDFHTLLLCFRAALAIPFVTFGHIVARMHGVPIGGLCSEAATSALLTSQEEAWFKRVSSKRNESGFTLSNSSYESSCLHLRYIDDVILARKEEGRDLAGVHKNEGLAVPKANKERQRALCGHLHAELGLEAKPELPDPPTPWLLLACGIVIGWVLAVCFYRTAAFTRPFPFSPYVNYFSAVFTIWRDELGIGRLFEASGIPLTTGAGASMTIAARSAIVYLAQRGFAFRALNL